METNVLVRHKKYQSLGIGCIAKVLKQSVKVNFGTEDVMTCKPQALTIVDTSKCQTITFHEFQQRILHEHSELNRCIIGNELKEYVGIGWVTLNVVTEV